MKTWWLFPLIVLVACSDEPQDETPTEAAPPTGDVTPPDGDGFSRTCESLSWSGTEAVPFGRLSVTGVPEGDSTGVAIESNGELLQATTLERGEDGTAEVVVPPIAMDGQLGAAATVDFVVIDEDFECPPHSVSVAAMPAAPAGTFERIFELLTEIRDESLVELGTDLGSLRAASATDLSAPELTLKLADLFLNAPEEDESPEEQLKDTAAGEVLSAMAVASGWLEQLEVHAESLRESNFVNSPASASTRNFIPRQAAQGACVPLPGIQDTYLNPETTEDLVDMMETQGELAANARAASTKIRKDMQSVISGLTTIVFPLATAAAANLMFGWDLINDLRINLYPSFVVPESFVFSLDDEGEYYEDFQTEGDRADYFDAEIEARNLGFNLTLSAIDFILTQSIGSKINTPGRIRQSLTESHRGFVTGVIKRHPLRNDFSDAYDTVVDTAAKESANRVKGLLGDADCLTIPAITFGPFDVTDRQYTEPSVSVPVVEFEAAPSNRFELVDTGSGLFTLTLNAELFRVPLEASLPIDVREKFLSFNPSSSSVVTAGDTQTLTLAISRSDFDSRDDIDVTVSPVTATLSSVTETGPGFFEVVVVTPSNEMDFPVTVFAESLSDTLPADASPRTATATIDIGASVTITPVGGCVAPGEAVAFSALVEGGTNPMLSWSSTGGTLMPAGTSATWSASARGDYEITVTIDGTTTSDTAFYTVGECTRSVVYYTYNAGAGLPFGVPGEGCLPGAVDVSGSEVDETISLIPEPFPFSSLPGPAGWTGSGLLATKTLNFVESRPFFDSGSCATVGFNAFAEYRGSVFASGGEIDVDFGVSAQAICRDVRGDIECSSANASQVAQGWIEADVSQGGTVRLRSELTCSGLSPNAAIVPFLPPNTPAPPITDYTFFGLRNSDPSPVWQFSGRCDQVTPNVSIDAPFEVLNPSAGGDSIYVVVTFTSAASPLINVEPVGFTVQAGHRMNGFVRVERE